MSRIKAAYMDWNGTLIKHRDEKPLFRYIAMGLVKAAATGYFFPGESRRFRREHPKCRVGKLLETRKELEDIYRAGQNGEIPYGEMVRRMYSLYNERVIDGIPLWFLSRMVGRYAEKAAQELDEPVLDVLRDERRNGSLKLVVIGPSSAYRDGIRGTIKRSRYSDGVVDGIIANGLEIHPDCSGAKAFEMGILDPETKRRLLENDISCRFIEPGDTAYAGDSEMDYGCFEFLLDRGGVAIVPPLAEEGFKERATRDHPKIRIANNAEEFKKALILN